MSYNKYSLDIISHHANFKNKSLRKYYVDGIDTVGAWGDEPFEVVFRNHTSKKIQVKLTIDGTDVLTGTLASTDVTKDMWVVNGYQTLSLKAWPETNNGGAQLVFTSGSNSVAVHTHGNFSSRGIIAAAVYEECYVEPVHINSPAVIRTCNYPIYSPIWSKDYRYLGDKYLEDNITCDSIGATDTVFSCNFNDAKSEQSHNNHRSEEKLVAVGAGQHVDQKITHVAGLIKPTFTETVRVKYMWWDDLLVKLRTNHVPTPHASGFPADQNKTNINLGNTPRIGSFQKNEQTFDSSMYSRV